MDFGILRGPRTNSPRENCIPIESEHIFFFSFKVGLLV